MSNFKKIFSPNLFILFNIKVNYHQKNKDKILKKAHEKYHNVGGKEKAKKYYRENEEEIKKRERESFKKLDRFEKKGKIKRSLDRYYRLKKEKEESE